VNRRLPQDRAHSESTTTEAVRLEQLWRGDFGDAYTSRNRSAGERRNPFWLDLQARYQFQRALEVGCNLGANIQWLTSLLAPQGTYGIDVNFRALVELRRTVPSVSVVCTQARALPFRSEAFDMVFTIGVLIHQPPEALPTVMAEIVRCSRRFVLCAEYFARELTEVAYRGQTRALFKGDFGRIYQDLFPTLTIREQGSLAHDEGWDDVTYWLLEKRL
jgi:pseudaminic acid biosynthesis-associated methylase